jgi:hypothetical protein
LDQPFAGLGVLGCGSDSHTESEVNPTILLIIRANAQRLLMNPLQEVLPKL